MADLPVHSFSTIPDDVTHVRDFYHKGSQISAVIYFPDNSEDWI
jgi:hypothetical protein